MTFGKRVFLLFTAYLFALGLLFGPMVAEVLLAESSLGRLPVKAKLSPEQRILYVREAVLGTVKVEIYAYDDERGMGQGYGTGSVFTEDGYILTAAHVAEDKEYVFVTFHQLNGTATGFDELRKEPADVLAVSHEHDMAIIKLRHPERVHLTVLPIDPDSKMPKGSAFWFIGSTSGVKPGIVRKVDATDRLADEGEPNKTPMTIKQITIVDTDADHGDSGGPSLDPDGNITGIVIASDGHGTGVVSPLRHGFAELLKRAQEKAKTLK